MGVLFIRIYKLFFNVSLKKKKLYQVRGSNSRVLKTLELKPNSLENFLIRLAN